MTVALRILTLLLSLFVAGPLVLTAHALVRPETRVGGSPDFSSVFASASSSQVPQPHQENLGCGYDFALAVHKYLYCHNNPVNGKDPSGRAAYFVKCALGVEKGDSALVAGYGHGFLLFTDPSDAGKEDPFTTGQRNLKTFSWHPYTPGRCLSRARSEAFRVAFGKATRWTWFRRR